MSFHRTIIRLSALLASLALGWACGGDSATAPEPARPTTVTVSPATRELTALGTTVQLSAEVRDQNARVMAGATVTWTSSANSVATVDASGLVTVAGNGTATITASVGSASGSAVVTVMQSVASVEVSPSVYELTALGQTVQLTAEAFDENGHAVSGAEFSWESSDAAVATVDAGGLVTAVAEGVATITASAGSAQGTAEITVGFNPDRATLVALYEATDGPNWVDSENWLTDAPLGDWYGVDVDGQGRVVRLLVLDNKLTGPIPPELGNLASLTRLDLGYNNLSGPIPREIGNLPGLRQLVLIYNDLTGPIPSELGNLASLSALWLRDNNLSGIVPAEVGDLVGLTELSLQNNALSGPIPHSFLQLDRLRRFFIGGNGSLCVPGTSSFVAWLQGMEHNGASCNAADVAALESLFEATGGKDWIESTGWRGEAAVEEWYGVTADALGRVTELDLTRNGLVGQLPLSLGDLVQMTVLRIGSNALTGRLPELLTRLSLREFHYAGTELCAPAEAAFRAWLDAIESHDGTGVECAPLSDREILEIFYAATGGPNWTNSDNWLTDAPLRDWFGVGADGEGSVRTLRIEENNLQGPIPAELGNLANLTSLSLGGNELSGPIPPELGNLSSLTRLALWGNELGGPIPPELGNLASLTLLALWGNELGGPIPPELGNLSSVEDLFLSSNALSGSIPPELGNLPSVVQLSLGQNDLSGPIPSELGGLATLERLLLGSNNLTGRIPPELGNLAKAIVLHLYGNALSGPIPGDLGRLASMEWMVLWGNRLTGSIPPEIGNLANMEILSLSDNELSGPIPPELGDLSSVTYLALDGNALAGPLPGALGNLSTVEELILSSNALTGPVPPEFGGMSNLKQLVLTNNAGMEGALPSRLTGLRRLEGLLAEGTDLCASSDPAFQSWLEGVHKRRIQPCAEGDPPMAYLTQAVQSQEYPVPLVAGEQALLRVFPTARQATSVGIPAVRARFYVNGRETHVEDIPGKSTPIPTEADESSLSKSANAEIPADVIRPGLEMVIEVDPDGTLDSGLVVAKRIPETGRLAVDVRAMPLFDLTLVPFIWTETRDSSIVDLIEAMAADPENHEILEETRALLPVGDLAVTEHEPVLSSSNNAFDLRANAQAIRTMEGKTGHYMGMMPRPVTGAAGVAFISTRVSFSIPFATTIAHELGHNMSLYHAPCGGAGGPDPSYPYPDGSIGAWGYDFRDGGSLVHPRTGRDLMSYCNPRWISDYSFSNALRYRLFDEGSPAAAVIAASSKSLLLWGGVAADSVPYLEPIFVVNAPPTLPDSAGEHRITGRTASGGELFSLSFAMPEVADGDGSSSFAFVLPARPGWADALASITLSGPGGSVTVDRDSDLSMAILRNPRTGQVRGILRDLPPATQAARAAVGRTAGPGLEVLISRGIPDVAAWRR